ncbi:segregation and condensation protein A [Oceanibacterium hippocampi]|uniref:Segregation and condensation protein A n=1 Tax=Oceanibacterium hippocampi TaxID=745714 RepID=A0A1Y5U565_9PROT|nr:ScpA family protein [Oceanibacterium hippocampi]SLN77231.1 Segregation and condensation protein A [Oceanibacterium hippocampi]
MTTTESEFESATRDGLPAGGESLILDLEGYEGPLDLLLALARDQKVDLRRISILALAEQYLAFIEQAHRIRIEVAADYLVMAAWLAFLKSRLLLPEPQEEGPSGEEMAARLAFQLQRLEAMRAVAARLMAQPRFGEDRFARGRPEGITVIRESAYECSLYELLHAYAQNKAMKGIDDPVRLRRQRVYSIEDALARLERLLGSLPDWATLQAYLPAGLADDPFSRRSAIASTLLAGLQMVKDGRLELRQGTAFGPIHVKKAEPRQ